MKISTKSALIENTGADDDFPGTFQVVLSTGTKDRDGEEVRREEWQEPLPEHITFDVDHGMSVEKTIGSGRPYFDDDGRLLVDGDYSSLAKAQDVRTLVKEGHIRTVSVAFARHTTTDEKSGAKTVSRELLNGAFVAIPANTEAVVLASKAGARHNAADAKNVQAIHDAAAELGATCAPMDDSEAEEDAMGGKHVGDVVVAKAKYDAEQLHAMLDKGEAMANAEGEPSYPIADREDLEKAIRAVGRGSGDHDKIRAYIIGRAKALDLADLIPEDWNADGSSKALTDAETKALDPAATVSVCVSGYAGGFSISIDAWCVPAAEIDAYADSAQRALSAAMEIASGGPVDDDADSAGDEPAAKSATPEDVTEGGSNTDAKSADMDALNARYSALSSFASVLSTE